MSRCCGGFTAGVVPSAGDCPCLAGSASVSCPQRKGAEPHRHWLALPRGRGPSQTPKFLSPGPPSPWLPALPIERRFYRFCTELATPKTSPPASACLARSVSAASGSVQGCRGRSPRRNKLLVSPFPRGEGGRGDGGDKANQRQGWQATKKARPPLETAAARSAGNQPGKPPAGRVIRAPAPVPPGFSPGDARGEAPCIRKQKISPFPRGEGGRGDGGSKVS